MFRRMRVTGVVLTLAAVLVVIGTGPSATLGQQSGLARINHVIVVYQENWSFDSLYGKFPLGSRDAGTGDLRQAFTF
jgi:phospholipase C